MMILLFFPLPLYLVRFMCDTAQVDRHIHDDRLNVMYNQSELTKDSLYIAYIRAHCMPKIQIDMNYTGMVWL